MKKDPASSNTTPRQSRSNVVPLKGEIDLHVSPTVTAALNDVIDKKPERLVVDLSGVSYIDSAGLAALIQALQKVEGYGGKCMLAGLQETVRSMSAERAASRREGSDQNRIASRKPTRFAGLSTIDPCTPSSMISLNPLERGVITGNPLASASRQALEKGS